MKDRVYFTNDTHDRLIGMTAVLIAKTEGDSDVSDLVKQLHQTLLSEYLQDEGVEPDEGV